MSPFERIQLRAYTFYENRADFVSNDKGFAQWVLIAPQSGSFRFQVGLERGEARAGALVLAAPREVFWRHTITPLTYHVLQWSFVDENGELTQTNWEGGKWPVRDEARLNSTLDILAKLRGRHDAWGRQRIENLLEDLLHLAHATRHEPPPVHDRAMREAARSLRERAPTAFSMADIAREAGLGPVQFTRRFRGVFGCNPIEFATQIRLENAQKMLVETDWTIDEIAARCGWASGAYLAGVFAKHLGTTPGNFRRLHRV